MNRALFLDRDGVINEDYGYVHKIEDFHFREGIYDVCRAAQKARMKIIVVTNQAGIGRGIYTLADFTRLNTHMIKTFKHAQVNIDGVYFCPHHPSCGIGHLKAHSYNRKPFPGMLITACRDHCVNPFLSLMIGDKDSDRDAAYAIGIRTYIDANARQWEEMAIDAITA